MADTAVGASLPLTPESSQQCCKKGTISPICTEEKPRKVKSFPQACTTPRGQARMWTYSGGASDHQAVLNPPQSLYTGGNGASQSWASGKYIEKLGENLFFLTFYFFF